MAGSGERAQQPRVDHAVRPARPADADAIAEVQIRAWLSAHAASLAGLPEPPEAPRLAARWRDSVQDPPSPDHRVLVATEADAVVGVAAVTPPATASGPGEILALEVDPARARRGHGSRLLAACTDLLREAGATAVRTWVLEDDGARAGFLRGAGLAPDGQVRHLDVGGRPVREESWSAGL